MIRKPYFRDYKKVFRVSFGLIAVLGYAFLLFHTAQFVESSKANFWWTAIISYSVMLSLIMGVPTMRNKLFNVSVFKFFFRFVIFYIPSFILLKLLLGILPSVPALGILGLLSTIPAWLLFVHGFVFALIESVIWQGFLDYEIGHPWSELIAGVFHWGVWQGGAIVVIPSAALLFAVFSVVNWYFRKNTDDIAPASALHTAYNHLKLISGT